MRAAPLQNRVDPWGVLHAVPARGTLMGNRGILHVGQHVVKRWAHKAWVHCMLDASFQKRRPFSPNTYSELFFLDEATALAAGHRPCRTCQRQRHVLFNRLWTQANLGIDGGVGGEPGQPGRAGRTSATVATIDEQLHAERVGPDKAKRTHAAMLAGLPAGTLFAHGGQAWLVWPAAGQGACLPWSFNGYGKAQVLPADAEVQVLTPPSIVHTLRAGYLPAVHPSAQPAH